MDVNNTVSTTDYWKEPEFNEDDVKHPFFCKSEFKILFPDYRSEYIQTSFEIIKKILSEKKLNCNFDLTKREILVSTTSKTRDPYVIIKARDFLKLISRSVPINKAKMIFQDNIFCEIVKIGNIVKNKDTFARRRQRLVGPNGSTLKAIEILTECFLCVSGQTVAVIGPHNGIKRCSSIILDCMNNFHPIYKLKTLMVEKELSKNQELKDKSWNAYLPKFKKSMKTKKSKKSKKD